MLQVGLGLSGSPRGAAEDFLLDQLGKRSRSYLALVSSGGGDMEATQGKATPEREPRPSRQTSTAAGRELVQKGCI